MALVDFQARDLDDIRVDEKVLEPLSDDHVEALITTTIRAVIESVVPTGLHNLRSPLNAGETLSLLNELRALRSERP